MGKPRFTRFSKKAVEDWSMEVDQMRQELAHSQHRFDTRGFKYAFTAFFVSYFLILFIPDSAWLNMGINLPDAANIPDFASRIIGYSSFPVSSFIFIVVTPFYFIIMLSFFLISVIHPCGYESFLLNRKKQIEKGTWNSVPVFCIIFSIIYPWLVWNVPSLLDPSNSTFFKYFNVYQNKLAFFAFFGCTFGLLVPFLISTLCAEIRFRLTNKEI